MKRILSLFAIFLLLCGTALASDEDKLIYAAKTGNLKNVQKYIDENFSTDTSDKYGKTIIMLAAASGRYNVAEYLLSKGANPNKSDNKGYTLMHVLAESRSKQALAFMEKVLSSGARTGDTASNGETPAAILIRKGNLQGVQLFLEKGDFMPDRNAGGVPAIVYAYKYRQVKIVKLLADKGAKLNVYDEKRNPLLHLAASKNDIDTVKYLIDKGALVDIKNTSGETPLLSASAKGYSGVMQYLIEKGADQEIVDSSGRNILHRLAAVKNSSKIIGSLRFDRGVINRKDQSGITPIAYAVLSKRWENVKPLADIGCDVNYTDTSGKTLLMMVLEGRNTSTAKVLIESGADVKSPDSSGFTPLHIAAGNRGKNWDEIMTLIIQKGGDVNAVAGNGVSAAGRAIDAGNSSGFRILAGNGLNINFREQGSVPLLLYAYRKNQKGIASDIMKSGADVTAKDGEGNSLIHVLAEKNDMKLYKSLSSYNFNLNLKNNSGQTPLLTAIEKGNFSFAQMLMNEKEKVSFDVKDNSGMTVMHYLASMKGGDKLLLNESLATAPVNVKDSSGRSPLAISVHSNLTANAGYFISRGADAAGEDWNGVKLVLVGYDKGRGMLNLLLEKGADPGATAPNGITLLHMSIEKQDLTTLKLLVQKGVDINKGYRNGSYPLLQAIYKGNSSVIQFLIQSGADTNVRDGNGTTPLIAAVESKDVKTAEYLVKGGANVNVTNSSGKYLILVAYETNRIDVFNILVSGGARLNESFEKGRLIHMAASGNRVSFLSSLIKGGADLNARDSDNKTAVMLAAEKGYNSSVKVLAAGGADLSLKDSLGETALYKAVRIGGNGGYYAADALIKGGAQVNDTSSAGVPVLHEAVNGAKFQFVTLLLKGGADPNILSKKNESAILLLARTSAVGKNEQYKLTQAAKAIAELISKGGDPDIPDKYGRTPLDISCKLRSKPVVEALLKSGVKVNNGDQYGNTTLKKVIMDYTGDYKISAKEKKAALDIIDLLIKNGADINVKDKSGRTPLAHIIREVNQKNQQKVIDIVPELLSRGALADIRDNDNRSAADYAADSRISELQNIVR
ncbi:MAG TPA: ankyrin repeat domain-containing protein [Spirochaetota bacterium]|nr:ankyrin repeat domain-containing protein [Spirochaetota bacterium]